MQFVVGSNTEKPRALHSVSCAVVVHHHKQELGMDTIRRPYSGLPSSACVLGVSFYVILLHTWIPLTPPKQFYRKVLVCFYVLLCKNMIFVKDILAWLILMYYLLTTKGAKTSFDDAYSIYLLFFPLSLPPSEFRSSSLFIRMDIIAS